MAASGWRRTRTRAVAGLAAAGLAGGLLGIGGGMSPAGAAPGDIGREGPAYVQASDPTAWKAESKVWFNDGFWWADMLRTVGTGSADHYIHKLVNGTWQTTNTKIDSQASTNSDVLWDGTKLYVATHHFANVPRDNTLAEPDTVSELYRYSYDAGTDTYTADAGFNGSSANRVVITPFQVEVLTIAKAGNRLWATWVQQGQVYVNSTTAGNDAAWGTPAPIGTAHSTVSQELPAGSPPPRGDSDISTIASFGGQVGILWSNQLGGSDGYYFATESGGTWTEETVFTSSDPLTVIADDHVDLAVSDAGQVFAVIKTRQGGNTPQIRALRRNGAGNWSAPATVWNGNENMTRPIIVIDEDEDQVQVFATGPKDRGTGQGETGGTIYRKISPMAAFDFGADAPVIKDADQGGLQNPTSTKQTVGDATGLVVLAATEATDRYWHHYDRLAPIPICGPFIDNATFADQQFRDFLGRPATDAEKTFVTARCEGGTPASTIVLELMRNEAFNRPYGSVTRLYSAYFLRLPDKGGLDYYVGLLRGGYPLDGISSGFAGSGEFRARYGSLTDPQFVTRIYNNVLDRNPSTNERDYWVRSLRVNTRGAVMKGFSESAEYKAKMRNEVELVLVYRGMLDRMITTSEYNLLRAALDGRTKTIAEVVEDILASPEYDNRVN